MMNYMGILVGLGTFVVIGVFHPIVKKTEYHFGKNVWPLFLACGIAFCAVALFVENPLLASLLAVVGFSSFWSIRELFEQEQRVAKGWFPTNPKRTSGKATDD